MVQRRYQGIKHEKKINSGVCGNAVGKIGKNRVLYTHISLLLVVSGTYLGSENVSVIEEQGAIYQENSKKQGPYSGSGVLAGSPYHDEQNNTNSFLSCLE